MKLFSLLAGASLIASPAYANGGSFANASALPAPAGISVGSGLKELIKGGLVSALTAFTNAGTAVITNRITQAGTAPKFLGWGTGTTTAAITQTALVTESTFTTTQTNGGGGGTNTRSTGTESRTTGTNTNDQYTVTATMTSTATQAITEVGAFDQAATGGNMNIRSDFAAINVVNGDSIAFTINLKFVSSAA